MTPDSLLNSIKSGIESSKTQVFSWAYKNPRLFLGAGAASVLAPLFFKNDERGYTKTAMITTPLFIAGAMASSKAMPSFLKEVDNFSRVIEDIPINYGFTKTAANSAINSIDMSAAAQANGRISSATLHRRIVANRTINPIKTISPEQLENEFLAAQKQFTDLYAHEQKRFLLSSAIHHTNLKYMSAAERATGDISVVGPNLDLAAGLTAIESNKTNPEWLRELNFRLGKANTSIVSNQPVLSFDALLKAGARKKVIPVIEDYKYGITDLASEYPKEASILQSAIEKRHAKAEQIEFLYHPGERTLIQANKPLNKLTAIIIDQGKLTIPLGPNPFIGDELLHRGMSIGTISKSEGVVPASEYLIRMWLSKGILAARKEGSALNHYNGRDALERKFIDQEDVIQIADATAAKAKSTYVKLSELPGAFPSGSRGDNGTWSSIINSDYGHGISLIRNLGEEQGMIRASGGTELGVGQTAEAADFGVMGVVPGTTEDLRLKTLKGGVRTKLLDKTQAGGLIVDKLDVPRVALHRYQVPDGMAAFFSSLPEWEVLNQQFSSSMTKADRVTAIKNFFSSDQSRLVNYIADASGISELNALKAYNKFLPVLTNERRYRATRRLGSALGDVATVVSDKIGARYTDRVGVTLSAPPNITQDMLDKPFGRGRILGLNKQGVPVTAEGDENILRAENIQIDDLTGEVNVVYDRVMNLNGTKAIDTVKSNISAVLTSGEGGEFNAAKGVINSWFKATGEGGSLPSDLNGFILEEKGGLAAKNPIEGQLSQTERLIQRLQLAKGGGVVEEISPYLDKLSSLGAVYNADDMKIHLNHLAYPKSEELRRANTIEANDIIAQMFADVGERIRVGEIKSDRFLQEWLTVSKNRPNMSLQEYAFTRDWTTSTAFVDHMNLNGAQRIKTIPDSMNILDAMGLSDVTTHIMGRSTIEGDVGMTSQYVQQIESILAKDGSYDYSKPFGKVHSFDDIRKGLKSTVVQDGAPLNNPANRTGLFDPSDFKENGSIKIGDEYFPFLGHDAYRGQVNEYDGYKYATSDSEKEVQKIVAAMDSGEDWKSLADPHLNSRARNLGLGKDGVLRPTAYDPLAVGGRNAPRASTWIEEGKTIEHEVGIGDRLLETFSEANQAKIKNGEVFGFLEGFPTNDLQAVKVKYDPTLNNTKYIGTTLLNSSNSNRDYDGDPLQLHVIFEEEHAKVLKRFALDSESSQNKLVALRKRIGHQGVELTMGRKASTPLALRDKILKAAAVNNTDAMVARTTGAAVGMSSNTRSLLDLTLANSNGMSTEAKENLAFMNFQLLDQSAIYAQKGKGATAETFESFMNWQKSIRRGLNNSNSSDDFISAMRKGLSNFSSEGPNLHAELFESLVPDYQNLHKAFHSPGNENLAQIHSALVASTEGAQQKFKGAIFGAAGDLIPNNMVMSGAKMGTEALAESNAATSATRRTVGRVGEAAKDVADSALRSFGNVAGEVKSSGAKKVLAIGLGLAALGGLLGTSMRSPREGTALAPTVSGNKYRPEESMGSDGEIPGEPVEGSVSPSNPPRIVHNPRRGVTTTVVAPMGRDTDLELTLKAEDRSRSAEVAKMAARLASQDGASSVTINYRDATRLGSLRTKQKIKDILNG